MQEDFKAGNYKAYNILHKINYWQMQGEDPSFLFQGLDLDFKTLKETDWLDFLSQVKTIWDNERQKMPDPRDHEMLGYDVYQNQSMGAMEVAAKLCSLSYIFKKFVDFSRQYSLVEFYDIRRFSNNSAVLIYGPKEEFVDHFGFSSPMFVKGFLRAMPKVHEPSNSSDSERIDDALVDLSMTQVSLEKLLNDEYAYITKGHDVTISPDELFVDGRMYAKKIFLDVEKGLYINRESNELIGLDNPLNKDGTGYLVIDDLVIGKTLLLQKGEIFDAPYSRFDVRWSRVPFTTRLKYFFRDGPSILTISRQKLVEQLEISDQRYFEARKAKQETEEALKQLKAEYKRSLRREQNMTGGFAHEVLNADGSAINLSEEMKKYHEIGSTHDVIDQKGKELLEHMLKHVPESELERIIPLFEAISDANEFNRKIDGLIERDLWRISAITNQIRSYNKMLGDVRGSKPVDIEGMINEYGVRLKTQFGDKDIIYSLDVEKGDYNLLGDETQIDSILRNIILNAVDAMAESPEKRIDMRLCQVVKGNEDYIRLVVSDTGQGILPEAHEDIFHAFYSTKPSTGTGLGLSIALRMAKLYDGDIYVQSAPGQGATFTVELKK